MQDRTLRSPAAIPCPTCDDGPHGGPRAPGLRRWAPARAIRVGGCGPACPGGGDAAAAAGSRVAPGSPRVRAGWLGSRRRPGAMVDPCRRSGARVPARDGRPGRRVPGACPDVGLARRGGPPGGRRPRPAPGGSVPVLVHGCDGPILAACLGCREAISIATYPPSDSPTITPSSTPARSIASATQSTGAERGLPSGDAGAGVVLTVSKSNWTRTAEAQRARPGTPASRTELAGYGVDRARVGRWRRGAPRPRAPCQRPRPRLPWGRSQTRHCREHHPRYGFIALGLVCP